MKRIIINVVGIVAIAALVIMGVLRLSEITERKDSRNKFADFYRQEENYDVLFLGQSHVLNGIFPMELWKEYGIVSYNLAGHGNYLPLNYWILKNALEYTTPKVVVIDTCMIGKEEKLASLEQLHISVDHIPYSKLKQEMVEDLVEDKERQKDFIWNFSTYHHRWNILGKEDFLWEVSVEKGAESRINVAVPVENMEVLQENYLTEETLGSNYLGKIIEECQQREIQVLLTYLPFPDATGWRLEQGLVEKIAKEYKVDFLSYETLYEKINVNTDFYDKDSHMNPSGARKITSFLGRYLKEHYGILDHRENEHYEFWHTNYDEYYQFKLQNLQKEEELKNLLMLLSDKEISYGIYINPNTDWSPYPVLLQLLENMGINVEQLPKEQCFLLKDYTEEKEEIIPLFEEVETNFGTFTMFYNEDGHLQLSCSKTEPMIITSSDIAVIVFDSYRLGSVTQKKFDLSSNDLEFMNLKD